MCVYMYIHIYTPLVIIITPQVENTPTKQIHPPEQLGQAAPKNEPPRADPPTERIHPPEQNHCDTNAFILDRS